MLMPTSAEFVALCQKQVALLTHGFGASLSVVYLTQQLVEGAEAHLVPIVAFPETAIDWATPATAAIPLTAMVPLIPSQRRLLERYLPDEPFPPVASRQPSAHPSLNPTAMFAQSCSRDGDELKSASSAIDSPMTALVPQRQMVLPLVHEEMMLGLLVVGRDDRGWTGWEREQIEQIAASLALACVLDQRYQWLQQERQQERLLQSQRHDRADNLLHQFRNSLTALQTFGKLIFKRLSPTDPNRNVVDSIIRETNRLKELSQQLEAVTHPEATPEPLLPLALPPANPKPPALTAGLEMPVLPAPVPTGLLADTLPLVACEITAVLEPLLASAQPIAQDHNLTLQTEIPAELPLVQTNPQALREVLNNLIENALKYTPAEGEVWVEVQPTIEPAPALEIAISDTGVGIPAQDLPHIFERRYRGVQAQTDIPGSGLGLAIAKTLVEQMQGEIELFSPARSARLPSTANSALQRPGTTFVVRLPIATRHRKEPESS